MGPDLTTKIEEYAEKTVDDIVNGNIGPVKDMPIHEWPLEHLADKLRQYYQGMDDINGDNLKERCSGNQPMESLRNYLRFRSVDAYQKKKNMVNKIYPDLMLKAERY